MVGNKNTNSAKSVVQDVFPESEIIENCVDKYPIKVIVTARISTQDKKIEIFKGKQQDLFSKYQTKRTRTMKQIQASLEEFKKKHTV
mmetsp:Transcript_46261/g.51597  ORF Transcript_46261/g.51597 Transcript_46261/m.51597 type:complete len:87 (-) Transcript_46261:227-487(-)